METKTLTIKNIENIEGYALYNDSIWEPISSSRPRIGIVAWITNVKEKPDYYSMSIKCIESFEDLKLYIERKSNEGLWRLAMYDEMNTMKWVGMRSEAGLEMYRLLDTLKDILIQYPVANTITKPAGKV